jgi:hypothetical protein
VLSKRANTPLAVLLSPVVLFKSAPAPHGRILICGVDKKRSRPHSSVEAASANAQKRRPTNCRIASAGGEIHQSVLPFGCVKVGISSVRRRNNRLRRRREGDESKKEQNCRE